MMLRSLRFALMHNNLCRSDVDILPLRNVCTSSRLLVGYKLKDHLRDCYSILNVSEDCNLEQLKAAYIEKAKNYHPDSGSSTADAKKFHQLQDAYKAIVEHRKEKEKENEVVTEEDMEPSIWNPRHKVPQHRQYLTFEGVGTGTPFERQKIYQKYRVARATEAVLEHKIHQLAVMQEDALVLKDKEKARKHKISNAIDRLVEDLIQEAMQRGDFQELPGMGKPLEDSRNPLVDSSTHNLNKILINNGYAPEWITLQAEIRQSIRCERERLAVVIKQLGEPPLSQEKARKLQKQKDNFRVALGDLNQKIDKFNIIVPFMNQQMVRFDPARQIRKVEENLETFLPAEMPKAVEPEEQGAPTVPRDLQMTVDSASIEWKDVWKHIREVFKS